MIRGFKYSLMKILILVKIFKYKSKTYKFNIIKVIFAKIIYYNNGNNKNYPPINIVQKMLFL